jgi:GNAT superfamily N-acetyltransferase
MTASRADWERYHAYRRQRHAEWRPDDPLKPDEVAETRLRWPDPFNDQRYVAALSGDEIAGWVAMVGTNPRSPEHATNRHLLWVHNAAVLERHRRQGVGRLLLGPVVDYMRERGATVCSADTEEESGRAFLEWLGAETRFSGAENRLDLGAVDWPMVEEWVREGERRAAGARVELYEPRLPDELVDEYCLAYTEMVNHIPFEDLDHGDIVYTPDMLRDQNRLLDSLAGIHHVALAWESDGSMSGVTEILRYPYEPDRVHQDLTAVHPRARGRGLGKWLKAALLLRVRDGYPGLRWVITDNAGSNAPMLAINHRLGFRRHMEQFTYQVTLAELAAKAAYATAR